MQSLSAVFWAALFYGVVTPLGFVLRLAGWDPLRLSRPRDGIWRRRSGADPMERQR